MAVGLTRLVMLVGLVEAKDYTMLIPMFVVFLSLAVSLKFMSFEKQNLRSFHDIGHIVGIMTLGAILLMIVSNHNHGWLIFSLSLYSLVLSVLYSAIFSGQIRKVFIFFLAILF